MVKETDFSKLIENETNPLIAYIVPGNFKHNEQTYILVEKLSELRCLSSCYELLVVHTVAKTSCLVSFQYSQFH